MLIKGLSSAGMRVCVTRRMQSVESTCRGKATTWFVGGGSARKLEVRILMHSLVVHQSEHIYLIRHKIHISKQDQEEHNFNCASQRPSRANFSKQVNIGQNSIFTTISLRKLDVDNHPQIVHPYLQSLDLVAKCDLEQRARNTLRQITPSLSLAIGPSHLLQLFNAHTHTARNIHLGSWNEHAPFARPNFPDKIQSEDERSSEVVLEKRIRAGRAPDWVEGGVERGDEAEDGENDTTPGADDTGLGAIWNLIEGAS